MSWRHKGRASDAAGWAGVKVFQPFLLSSGNILSQENGQHLGVTTLFLLAFRFYYVIYKKKNHLLCEKILALLKYEVILEKIKP